MTAQGNDRPGTPEGRSRPGSPPASPGLDRFYAGPPPASEPSFLSPTISAWQSNERPHESTAQPLPLAGSSWEGVASHPGCEGHPDNQPAWEASMMAADLEMPQIDPPGIELEMLAPLQLEKRGTTTHTQAEFWRSQTIFKNTVWAKLLEAGREEIADKIKDCHTLDSYLCCRGCNKATKVWNRCENFFCPECQPRLSRDRKEAVEWWAKQTTQPKHVVLTVRNTTNLTKDYVLQIKQSFSRLRRSRFAANWVGGFYSLEVTNEGRGWHLHIHALVESRYIDARQLATTWARCVGQDCAIVKVKDARGKDYLAEVTKYAVKGSELASWTGHDIGLFVDAFTGVRTFGVFGSLYGKRAEWSNFLKTLGDFKPTCSCGCSDFLFLSPNQLLERLETHDKSPVLGAPRPPPSKSKYFAFCDAMDKMEALRQ